MWPALKHGCEKQTPSTINLFSYVNMSYVSHIKMQKRVKSRYVYFSSTSKKNAAAVCPLLTTFAAKRVFELKKCAAGKIL